MVGETTGGGANPGERFDIGEGLEIFISTGRAMNPYSQSNWEKTGIIPHHRVKAENAYKKAISLIKA